MCSGSVGCRPDLGCRRIGGWTVGGNGVGWYQSLDRPRPGGAHPFRGVDLGDGARHGGHVRRGYPVAVLPCGRRHIRRRNRRARRMARRVPTDVCLPRNTLDPAVDICSRSWRGQPASRRVVCRSSPGDQRRSSSRCGSNTEGRRWRHRQEQHLPSQGVSTS